MLVVSPGRAGSAKAAALAAVIHEATGVAPYWWVSEPQERERLVVGACPSPHTRAHVHVAVQCPGHLLTHSHWYSSLNQTPNRSPVPFAGGNGGNGDDAYPGTSSTSTSSSLLLRQHPLPRALAALLHALHDPHDSTQLYALLLFHLHDRPPALLDRLHALLERARSRHEPLATTLAKAEDRLLLLPSPPSPSSLADGEEEGAAAAASTMAAALGEVRGLLEELRALAREKPASEVVLRYLEATGAWSSYCMHECVGGVVAFLKTKTHPAGRLHGFSLLLHRPQAACPRCAPPWAPRRRRRRRRRGGSWRCWRSARQRRWTPGG